LNKKLLALIFTVSFPILLTFAPIADAQTSVERERALMGTQYDGSAPQPEVEPQVGIVNPCDFQTTGDPAQCAWIPFAALPPYAAAAVATQGVILNPLAGNVLIISSGPALDPTPTGPLAFLSVAMGANSCVFNGGLNPGGFITLDCVTLEGFHFDQTYFSFGVSSEMAEFQGSPFTDQFRTNAGAGSFLTDIDTWDASLIPGLQWIPWGPVDIVPGLSTSTNGFTFIGADIVIDAEVADSSDQFFDSMILFLAAAAFEDPPITEFCGDGIIQPGEQCDPPNGTTCDAFCQDIIPPDCTSDVDCNDGQFCTLDTCNTALGICEFAPNPDPSCERVGGEFIGVDNSALLVAGFEANALWLLPAIAAIGIGVVVIRRIR